MNLLQADAQCCPPGARYNYAHQFPKTDELLRELERMLVGGRYVLTAEVREFETAFARYCVCKHARGVNSGTDALLIALRAIGIQPGDRVITQANTFHATVAAIELAGAVPVLVDAKSDTFLIDEDQIPGAMTGRVKAIIPVHLYGKPTPMSRILALAGKNGITVLEDAAQAHGATIDGRRAGSFGAAGCFSFHPSKNLAAAGDGGAIVTNSDRIAEQVELLRSLGQERQNEHVLVGFNSKLDALQACILNWKLPYLDEWNRARRRVATWYRNQLANTPVYFQKEDAGEIHVYHLFQIGTRHRDALCAFLVSRGIDAVIRYPEPIHLQPAFRKWDWRTGAFPVAERLARELLCLPIRPDMEESDVAFVADNVRAFFEHEYRGIRVTEARPGAAVACAQAYVLAQVRGSEARIGDPARFTMRTSRKIEYPVVHPELSVFDIRERTLADVITGRPVLLVADATVAQFHRHSWSTYAGEHFRIWHELILKAGEAFKTWDQVSNICAKASEFNLPRNAVIVGVGGGTLLDVAGLAAAVFRRGIGLVRVPTTLVGLVDVAIGIKQGVNAFGRKNLLGAFYPPLASINDYRFTKTLPRMAIACGIAEIVKIALIRDAAIFESVEKCGKQLVDSQFTRPERVTKDIALRSELLMMEQLATNLFETDLARLVDFGHTFSPTIENASQYRIPHGSAVAMDMLLSCAIAVTRSIAGPSLLHRLLDLTWSLGLLAAGEELPDIDILQSALEEAKRHRGGCLNLVVVGSPGQPVFLQDVRRSELESARELIVSQPNSAMYDVKSH
ncbi:MAG TPA: iron-containing alcohol dehydrogenase [Bryobacteraceae bacterium]